VEKQLQLEPISALDVGSRLASRPGRITPSESHAVSKPLAVRVVPRAALGDREKRDLLLEPGSNHDSLVVRNLD
jgi:hypothetical protein